MHVNDTHIRSISQSWEHPLARSYHQKNTELEWNQTDGLINGVRLLGTAQQRSETLSNSSARCCRGVGVVMICIVV